MAEKVQTTTGPRHYTPLFAPRNRSCKGVEDYEARRGESALSAGIERGATNTRAGGCFLF